MANKNTAPNPVADSGEVVHEDTHHIVPISTYNTVIGLLAVLLLITVAAATFDLNDKLGPAFGWANITVAMIIAVAKGLLIMMYFMHLKFSSKVVVFFAAAGFIWITAMFGLGLADYFTRGWILNGH